MAVFEVDRIVVGIVGIAIWLARLRPLYGSRCADAGDDASVEMAGDVGNVSVIVPARNEAHNLPQLIESLVRLDPAPAEIIVVDDGSTDGTGDIARRAGAAVINAPPLPDGWLGKPWACHIGARAARGTYILFTDADTVHARDSLGRALASLHTTGAGLLSVVPTHIVRAFWERWQGIFHLLLLIAGGAGRAHRSRGERRFSIGQYLLFRRDVYDRIGGHCAVRARIAEDLALARMVEVAGQRFELLFCPGLLSVRMYPEGLVGFIRGWRRSFREGMSSSGLGGVVELVFIIGWLLGAPLLIADAALAGELATTGIGLAIYLATAAEIARRQRHLGALPAWSALAFPVFVMLFVMVAVLAMLDRVRRAPVSWKQRRITI